MEYELVEVTFGAYECVREESTEMLAELHEVVYPHGSRCLVKAVNVLEQIQTSAVTAHPRGHKAAGLQDQVGSGGADRVVDGGPNPLHDGVASHDLQLPRGVFADVEERAYDVLVYSTVEE